MTHYLSQVVEEFRENSTLHNLGERAAVILPRLRRLLSLRRQQYNSDADMEEEEDLASASLETGGPCFDGPTEVLSVWGQSPAFLWVLARSPVECLCLQKLQRRLTLRSQPVTYTWEASFRLH